VKWLRNPRLHALLGLVLGALFVYASLDKIAKPGDFARIIYHYQLIGPNQHVGPLPANLLAVTLPFVEILAGLLLIVGLWRREAALVTAAMLVVFILAVSVALVRGIDVENCGCFSVTGSGRAAGLKLILQDLAMLAAALVLLIFPPVRDRSTHEASHSPV
jgi:putative oxidoreductase